jgi:lipoprotein-releasing system permease protein
VMLLFIIEGAVVGAIGAAVGVAIGLIACAIGNHYKLVSLPADVYSISNVPLIARPSEMLIAALVAFLLSVLATIYPARAASRMRPVEALRDS